MTMKREHIAYLLIGIGALALLSRVSGGGGWIWVGLVAAAFLVGYSRERSYGLLVVGSILTGIAVGLLLEESWGWDGAFTVSLGIGFLAIDRIEQRSNRWPRTIGLILVALGVIGGLLDSGVFSSPLVALVLIAGGAYLLLRRRDGSGWSGWLDAGSRDAPPTVTPAPAADGTPAPADAAASAASATADTAYPDPADMADTPAASGSSAATDPAATSDTPAVEARREALERWRRETAAREDRAAYLILTNETLGLLAQHDPQTLDELKKIRGIGPVKLERYGPNILEVLRSV